MKKLTTLLLVCALAGCGGGSDSTQLDCNTLGETPPLNSNQMYDLEIVNDTLYYVESHAVFRSGFTGPREFIGLASGGLFGIGDYVSTYARIYSAQAELVTQDLLPGIPAGFSVNEAIYSLHEGTLFKLDHSLERQTVDLSDALNHLAADQQLVRAFEVKNGLLMMVKNDADGLSTHLYTSGTSVVLFDDWITDVALSSDQNQLFVSSNNTIAVYDYQQGISTTFDDLSVSALFKLNDQVLYGAGKRTYQYNPTTMLFDSVTLPGTLGEIHDAESYQGNDYLATQFGIWQVDLIANSATLIRAVPPSPLNDCSP